MQGGILVYGLLAGLAIALLVAAFTDIRSRTISNWLNLAIAAGAPLFWFASGLSLWPGVAHQVMVAPEQFIAAEAADFDKGLVGVGNHPLEVGARNQIGIRRKGNFSLGNRLIVFHLSMIFLKFKECYGHKGNGWPQGQRARSGKNGFCNFGDSKSN